MSAFNRFRNLWRQPALEQEFDEELRFHKEKRVEKNLRSGMSRADAEAEARRHLGNELRAKEGMREARVVSWMESLVQDLRFGSRVLLRQPGLAALAILTLSLGIGANAAMFSLLNAVLFRPLPFADAGRLVAIVDGFRAQGVTGVGPTVPELIDVRNRSRSLQQLSFFDTRDFQINGGQEPARVFAARIEASFLAALGVRPSLGRLFRDGENLPGNDGVVLLTDGLWRRNFGADPNIVDSQIMVNGAPFTVVGVLPPDFSFDYLSAEPIEMYVPFQMSNIYTSRSGEFTNVRRVMAVARLSPRFTLESASAELRVISDSLRAEYPELYRRGSDGQDTGFFMEAMPLQEALAGRSRPLLLLLLGAVGLVLLIACVNTSQFLLARFVEREHEVALRRALGASRSRLSRQFFAETLILGICAGIAGLLQAIWLMPVLLAILPQGTRSFGPIGMDLRVLAFTAAASLLATVACGVFPVLHFARDGHVSPLGGRYSAARARFRQSMVAVEVAISVVLLVTASLLIQSLFRLQTFPKGYSADGVMSLRMRLNGLDQTITTGPQYLERIAAIPGVEAAAIADSPLPGPNGTEFSIEGRPDDAATLSSQEASYRIVSPQYFSALRIPLLEGRVFSDDDTKDHPHVAIISEDLARRFWPQENAIGQRIRSGPGPRNALMTIIGVVGNIRPPLQLDGASQIYVPYLQQNEPNVNLLVRSADGIRVSPETIKKAIWSVTPEQPVFSIRPLSEVLALSMAGQRTVALLLGAFAVLALFMSGTGVYTIVAYLTSRRTREIAIRVAIGAKKRDVLRLVAGQVFRWTLAGLLAGLLGAVAASAGLRSALFGVVGLELRTMLLAAAVYLVVVALAMSVPALRALRVDPGAALRAE